MKPADFPLAWPPHHPRTAERTTSRFRSTFQAAYDTVVTAAEKLHDESKFDIIVSTNIPTGKNGLPLVGKTTEIADPGVAVYLWRGGRPYVVACDTYREVAHNLRAIAVTIEALRTVARHGTSALLEQSMVGFCLEIEAPEKVERKLLAVGG